MRSDRPSKTARKIAESILYVGADPDLAPVLPADAARLTAELLAACGLWRPWMDRLIRNRWYRVFVDRVVAALTPGHLTYLALRKRFLDEEVAAAIDGGAEQLLVLGGGYDTLALGVAVRHPDVTVVEVDHPASHRLKARGVERIGAARPNLHLVGADLGEEGLGEVLGGIDAWTASRRTTVVVEGVLMYLERAAVAALLAAVRGATRPDTLLLFTYIVHDERGRPRMGPATRAIQLALRLHGEPLLWTVPDDGIGPFLAAHGFDYDASPERYELGARFLGPQGLGAREVGTVEQVGAAVSSRG